MSPKLLSDFLIYRDSLVRIEEDTGIIVEGMARVNHRLFEDFLPTAHALHMEARMALARLDNEFEGYMRKHYGGK